MGWLTQLILNSKWQVLDVENGCLAKFWNGVKDVSRMFFFLNIRNIIRISDASKLTFLLLLKIATVFLSGQDKDGSLRTGFFFWLGLDGPG